MGMCGGGGYLRGSNAVLTPVVLQSRLRQDSRDNEGDSSFSYSYTQTPAA